MPILQYSLVLLAAYLLGGISFSYLAGRLARGVDLRRVGSGNLGASNVFRQLGWRWGIAVFLLDVAKGWLAVWLARELLGEGIGPVLAALAAILGHSFTPFLRFRGGKGVATSAGAFLNLAPAATGLALLAFLLVFLAVRIISVSSLAAALALPLALLWRGPNNPALLGLAILVALLVWLRHRSNIARLLRGEEPRFHFSRHGGE